MVGERQPRQAGLSSFRGWCAGRLARRTPRPRTSRAARPRCPLARRRRSRRRWPPRRSTAATPLPRPGPAGSAGVCASPSSGSPAAAPGSARRTSRAPVSATRRGWRSRSAAPLRRSCRSRHPRSRRVRTRSSRCGTGGRLRRRRCRVLPGTPGSRALTARPPPGTPPCGARAWCGRPAVTTPRPARARRRAGRRASGPGGRTTVSGRSTSCSCRHAVPRRPTPAVRTAPPPRHGRCPCAPQRPGRRRAPDPSPARPGPWRTRSPPSSGCRRPRRRRRSAGRARCVRRPVRSGRRRARW